MNSKTEFRQFESKKPPFLKLPAVVRVNMVQLKSLHEPPRYLLGLSTSEPSGTFISRFSGWISMLGRCHMVRMRHPWQMVMAMAHGSSSHIVSKSWTSISSHGLSWFSQHFFSNLNSHFWGKHIYIYI